MKKQRLDGWMLALTLTFGLLGSTVCILLEKKFINSDIGRILWSGLFFSLPLLCSLSGSLVAEKMHSRKFHIIRTGSRRMSFFLAALLGFLIGTGGQALYMLSVGSKGADMVLLLDGSGSMEECKDACEEAACSLVDEMNSKSRVKAVVFAGLVLGETELLEMNDEGREDIKDFIRAVNVTGGTNFDIALDKAQSSLCAESLEKRKKAVILVTDGQGTVSEAVKEAYLTEEIVLYTIRISQNAETDPWTQTLIDFSKNTGGFDTLVQVTGEGIQTKDMQKAFKKAFGDSSILKVSSRILAYGKTEQSVLWCLVIRTLVFMLYGILIGRVYYQRQKKGEILGNAVMGILVSAIISALGQLDIGNQVTSALIICVLLLAAYTAYCPEPEKEGMKYET